MKTKTITKSVLHQSDSRGMSAYNWLISQHTFSFADYFNPENMGFGALRVLNEDEIAPKTGFETHRHDNMEIISIPLRGKLEHKDDTGTTRYIKQGDVQVMSSGRGIRHSEYNASTDRIARFLQIWIIPNKKNVTPRYDQITLNPKDRKNKFQQIISPNPADGGLWIYQNAWFHITSLEKGRTLYYKLNDPSKNGVYAFLIEGMAIINGQQLQLEDGYGVWGVEELHILAEEGIELLLMEVPMKS